MKTKEVVIEEGEMVGCLGWCGKRFRPNVASSVGGNRFCKQCTIKKEQAERNLSKIRRISDGLRTPYD